MGSSLRNALLVCAGGTAVGCALIVVGFVAARSFAAFAMALAAGEFAMFMTQVGGSAGGGMGAWKGRRVTGDTCGGQVVARVVSGFE